MQVFDATRCELGEGLLWHPERGQIFWLDIPGQRLHSRTDAGPLSWDLPETVSALGWIDRDRLLLGSETGLLRFDLRDGGWDRLVAIEADDPGTRGNDGSADPWGGFWLGTMGRKGEEGRGALYRWYRGELRVIRKPMTTPNAMAFDTARNRIYVSDTPDHIVWMWTLDAEGWPEGAPQVFLDLSVEELNPDGGVVDTEGRFWSAQFGAGRVACYSPEGEFLRAEPLPASQTSCPAFGGPDLDVLFVTTGQENMTAEERAREPQAGMTFHARLVLDGRPVRGTAAPRVDAS
ncbi:SMP-30/gluconolactonase/LRE family protein [Falsirhodobacter sp. 20TX0035]|uniref:SMP-30/gluconolactonase/LRE family protein n=1 Tax=Falsirhodobacter sp. 20TX0035 TaxID=3022019 RepID=UPI00232CBA96|nr:SMP-30/gluconolactonase/LRE family protein [Falsirhodobacter sp. 20TX0035]MDB6454974.1 SMP-30/gluconolactonase/LRE family protein [Falsirhodobacter sp. 20TX0035]